MGYFWRGKNNFQKLIKLGIIPLYSYSGRQVDIFRYPFCVQNTEGDSVLLKGMPVFNNYIEIYLSQYKLNVYYSLSSFLLILPSCSFPTKKTINYYPFIWFIFIYFIHLYIYVTLSIYCHTLLVQFQQNLLVGKPKMLSFLEMTF